MKKIIFCSSILALVVLFLINIPCIDATSQTVAASTGEIELPGELKTKIDCDLQVSLNSPTGNLKAGESSTWSLRINSGNIVVGIYLPSPVNEWYSVTIDLQTVSSLEYNYQIAPGLFLTLRTNPSASLDAHGPAGIQQPVVTWDNFYQTKYFTVNCQTGSNSKSVTINADFTFDFTISLNVDLLVFSQDISSFPIYQVQLSPTVSETAEVGSIFDVILSIIFSPFILLFGGPLSILLLIMGVGIYKGRKKESRQVKNQTKPINPIKSKIDQIKQHQSKKRKYCIHCGEEFPDGATFCGGCGKPRE